MSNGPIIIKEMVILRMGILLSPPIEMPRGAECYHIPVYGRPSFQPIGDMCGFAPTQHLAVFTQQTPEYLQIGEARYRVLDYSV